MIYTGWNVFLFPHFVSVFEVLFIHGQCTPNSINQMHWRQSGVLAVGVDGELSVLHERLMAATNFMLYELSFSAHRMRRDFKAIFLDLDLILNYLEMSLYFPQSSQFG